ncbi:MAG: hypothetical protein ACRYFR_20245 [Janthinobacterium lividum]
MFYSHSIADSKFSLFTTVVSTFLNGRSEYKELVDGVIEEAHNYVLGKKNIYDISRENASIVIFLSQADTDFFKNINSECIVKQDYEHVYEVLNKNNVEEWTLAY